MLSILIPVFNWDVRPLVNDLAKQCLQLRINFEIILTDDCSTDAISANCNAALSDGKQIFYKKNIDNQGRSKTRNALAKQAHFDNLLFMDCDANVAHPNFIENYIHFIENHSQQPYVVLGGVAYRATPPDAMYRLRWTYGLKREQKLAAQRNLLPYSCFTPFNMLISKSVFDICTFDESLTTYGFEDTLFGETLHLNNVPIFHIDNALYHDGLDENSVYLKKVETSINNLAQLVQQNRLSEAFVESNKLLKTYQWCKRHHLDKLTFHILKTFRKTLKSLILNHYQLRALDLYKLYLLMETI